LLLDVDRSRELVEELCGHFFRLFDEREWLGLRFLGQQELA
jgi:hypothetical protein